MNCIPFCSMVGTIHLVLMDLKYLWLQSMYTLAFVLIAANTNTISSCYSNRDALVIGTVCMEGNEFNKIQRVNKTCCESRWLGSKLRFDVGAVNLVCGLSQLCQSGRWQPYSFGKLKFLLDTTYRNAPSSSKIE